VGHSWYIDETSIKVKGEWTYLYGAVDQHARMVEFLLHQRRNQAAEIEFLRKAIGMWRRSRKLTTMCQKIAG